MTKKKLERKTVDVHIRCEPEEKKEWEKKAHRRGQYLSELIRWLLNKTK